MACFQRSWVKEAPSFRNLFRQKEVYLNKIYDDFGLRSPPLFRKRFRQKEVYLNTIYDDFGLRSPVIQKTFHTNGAASIVARVLSKMPCEAHLNSWCVLAFLFLRRGQVVNVERGYQPPAARSFHAAVADEEAGRLYILGGFNGEVKA